MTDARAEEVLVVLNVPPSLEEAVVDWLLARKESTGFTSFPVSGHSTRHEGLSLAEQVSGRQARQQFQVQIAATAVGQFLEEARHAFGAAGIHYWALPLLAGGSFSH
jgi:hypothetical protein